MSQPIDNLFGMHTGALALWQRRTEVLASNLANADTPGYLARDVDFRKALAAAGGSGDGSLPLAAPTPGQIDPVFQAR
ncbi:MAG: flagellar basal body rod protein FlgB, partial [Frateuria sp.]|nr:flagellar basal body rod protein FlgB [Frateuria sp.]